MTKPKQEEVAVDLTFAEGLAVVGRVGALSPADLPQVAGARAPSAVVSFPAVDCPAWAAIASWPWRKGGRHINRLELIALLVGTRWLLSRPSSVGRRFLALVDSTAVVGAVGKGRSSSPALRLGVRRFAALALGGGLRFRTVWVPSALNPADAPSRADFGRR